MGGPTNGIDSELIRKLAKIDCAQEDIAKFFECSLSVISEGQGNQDIHSRPRQTVGILGQRRRFHDPDERSPDIIKLRELHAAMDRAVLDAYGWTDLWKLPVASSQFPDGLGPPCEFLLDYEEDEDEDDGLLIGSSDRSRRIVKPTSSR